LKSQKRSQNNNFKTLSIFDVKSIEIVIEDLHDRGLYPSRRFLGHGNKDRRVRLA
jgi:hypothetical protein